MIRCSDSLNGPFTSQQAHPAQKTTKINLKIQKYQIFPPKKGNLLPFFFLLFTVCELDGGEVEGGVQAAGVEKEGIDVGVGELVDEDGEAEVTAIIDEVLEEGGLAAAEEPGDEGAAHAAAGKTAAAVEHAVLK